MTPARARTRRRLAGLALSLGVHAALLAAFMSLAPRLVVLPRLPAPPQPAIEVELQRPTARAVASASAGAAAPSRARRAAAASPVPVRPALRPSDLPAPAPPSPRPAVAPATAPPGPATFPAAGGDAGRWRVRGEGGDAGAAARALARGTVGCGAADYLHLTADERDRCNAEFVRGMRTLQPDAIPAAKRAYYDAVKAAYAKMHAPMPFSEADLGDNLGLRERWRAPEGAHMPGFGCKIPLGKPRGWKTYANRGQPPHSLNLGPSPCFVTPPSGFGTEEADVAAPASLREQGDDAAHAARYAPPGSP